MSNNVQHPSHYNQHPAGIECIEIIRHYTCDIANAIKYLWRAGLKPEMGMDDAEKEIEDLRKALFYIEDYRKQIPQLPKTYFKSPLLIDKLVAKATGHTIDEISKGYEANVGTAINFLLGLGIICNGRVYVSDDWEMSLYTITSRIQRRILDIETALTEKELESTVQVLHGQAVDGEDYISKPACRRETEPEHYDPLNVIIAFGTAYCLSSEVRKRGNGSLHTPCENCALMDVCYPDWRHPDESQCRHLCLLHQAETNEYYREVGRARYAPAFGTIEVVDELKAASKREEDDACISHPEREQARHDNGKESELELKRLEEEMEQQ